MQTLLLGLLTCEGEIHQIHLHDLTHLEPLFFGGFAPVWIAHTDTFIRRNIIAKLEMCATPLAVVSMQIYREESTVDKGHIQLNPTSLDTCNEYASL
jgi:hypothetical protein